MWAVVAVSLVLLLVNPSAVRSPALVISREILMRRRATFFVFVALS